MRIEPSGTQAPTIRTSAAVSPKHADSPSEASHANAVSFSPTSQLANLLAKVRQEPDVRPSAVKSAMERLASGELDSPEVRAETAQRFVDSLTSE